MKKIIILTLFALLSIGSVIAEEGQTANSSDVTVAETAASSVATEADLNAEHLPPMMEMFKMLWKSTGVYGFSSPDIMWPKGWGELIMIGVGLLLLYLAIVKGFEPLLLIPISFGCIFANVPLAGMNDEGGILYYIYNSGIKTGVFPLLIFMGVGAMTDFGPMIANPITIMLGAAAQLGIFITVIGALFLSKYIPGINFSLADASSIGIIGGADGPTAIYVTTKLSPRLLGSIAVAAYSYMAMVPLIQPPIMKLCSTPAERLIKMEQLRYVGRLEKIMLPLVVMLLCIFFLPSAAPLMGFFMFGNLLRESGIVNRLSDTAQNALMNIVVMFLGLGVGAKLSAKTFLNMETLGILVLGVTAFGIGTAGGVLMARVMNLFMKNKINPLIGSAGVSAVPMAARVSQNEGAKADPQNFLLMHAMGPNVAGVIGSAVAAGVLLSVFGKM
ncbi:MAG TPA: sodium ion-translocating decarboxylase subunit beta [Bacteriovoracaceae bacterium]|nr:sodium ion-translocating decarboxylase subunit beta [Bacteriovoracaceae bacterium]